MINLLSVLTVILKAGILITFIKNRLSFTVKEKFAVPFIMLLYGFIYASGFISLPYIKEILFFIFNFFIFLILCSSCFSSALINSIFLFLAERGSYMLCEYLPAFVHTGGNIYVNSLLSFLLSDAAGTLLYFIIVKLCTHFAGREQTDEKQPVFPFLFPVFTAFLCSFIYYFNEKSYFFHSSEGLFRAVCIILCLSAAIIYIFHGRTINRINMLRKSLAEKKQAEIEETYYGILKKQNEELRIFIHDEKNHLKAIRDMAGNERTEKYIDEVYKSLEEKSVFGKADSKLTDVILYRYAYMCRERGISFTVSVTAGTDFMSEPDTVSFLGNILDNALENSIDSKEKFIDFSFNQVNGFCVLICRNSSASVPLDSMKTRKNRDSFHGLGLKSIRKTAEKYQGETQISFDEKNMIFTLKAVFPKEKEVR